MQVDGIVKYGYSIDSNYKSIHEIKKKGKQMEILLSNKDLRISYIRLTRNENIIKDK